VLVQFDLKSYIPMFLLHLVAQRRNWKALYWVVSSYVWTFVRIEFKLVSWTSSKAGAWRPIYVCVDGHGMLPTLNKWKHNFEVNLNW
jgi:hypothetical protein